MGILSFSIKSKCRELFSLIVADILICQMKEFHFYEKLIFPKFVCSFIFIYAFFIFLVVMETQNLLDILLKGAQSLGLLFFFPLILLSWLMGKSGIKLQCWLKCCTIVIFKYLGHVMSWLSDKVQPEFSWSQNLWIMVWRNHYWKNQKIRLGHWFVWFKNYVILIVLDLFKENICKPCNRLSILVF